MSDGDERPGAGANVAGEEAPGMGGSASLDDGWTGRRGTSFDPTPHIQQLRGRGGNTDYLGVRWSLVWLRKEHPDAQIVTEHVQIDPTIAIFKATVSLPTGGTATGYGSETAGDFGDYIEKAETKAIGRALRALGFGAPNSEGGDEAEASPPVAAPRPTAAASPAPARTRPTPITRPAPAPAATAPASSRPVAGAAPPARSRAATVAEPAPAAPRAARAADDAELADYSWSAFWPWARGIGLPDKKAIEDLIGRTTDGLLPADLRGLILTARGDG